MNNILFSLIIIIITSHIFTTSKKNDYDLLLEWGTNNSIYISDKIAMNYTNENNKNYYVKKKINKDEIIISIPKKLLLNIESVLNLLGPKTKKQYENYKKEHFNNNSNNNKKDPNDILSYRIDQSFLAYLMTIANKNKSNKNKFYQFYKYFFNTFETDLERFPVLYNTEQIRLLIFSLFGNELVQTKEMYDEEFEILQTKIYKKPLDQDEYYKYRIFTFNKLVNISGVSSIIPFVDMLETNPINFNLQINYTYENDSISVMAVKNIKKDDKLKMAVVQMTNSGSLITYGKVYEENKNYIENFRIPKISVNFLKIKNLDPMMAANGDIVDISLQNYYEEIIPIYMDLSKLLKEDGSKVSALRLFQENLLSIRDQYDKVTVSELFKYFYTPKYVNNIRSVLSTEKLYLNKKIREMKQIINKYAKESEQDL